MNVKAPESTPALCPACSGRKLVAFYELGNIPVHSCMLTDTVEAAREFPRGDLTLAHCADCGFITNVAFDEAVTSYTDGYEDQQAYSETFNRFARALAQRLVDKYQLHEKRIMEIGCGKGDFLALLCKLGANYGVGIDPTATPGRLAAAKTSGIRFVREKFAEKHGDYRADFYCCRHTLEHIHEPAMFLGTIRRAIGDQHGAGVFFEVPDTARILDEFAFEDIYYEHCSYFTPGSLGRLFRASGFEVVDLYRDYGDQYVMIEARPAMNGPTRIHPLEESAEQTLAASERFATAVAGKRQQWTDRLDNLRGERIAIWGSGSKCVAFLTTLNRAGQIPWVVDINPHRQGKYLPGAALQIRSPETLRDYAPHHIIVMNRLYLAEIQQQLDDMELSAHLIPL